MLNNARCRMGAGLSLLALTAIIAGVVSCGGAPTPFPVNGPGGVGNEPPTLEILQPAGNVTIAQGVPFIIQWNDTDRDDNASISFQLLEIGTNRVVILVSDIPENNDASDTGNTSTSLIPLGSYNLLGIIEDGVNPPVTTYATVTGSATERVVVRVVGAGEGQQSSPPIVRVVEPQFDRSVTQDDLLRVVVQPTAALPQAGVTPPFDADSDTTLFVLLDFDQDPSNDDPFNPDPSEIIVLQRVQVAEDAIEQAPFDIAIDLNEVPAIANGDPYFVRATISDGQNLPVHSYAPGRLNVVQLASGTVDLYTVGRNTSGARVYGFNPSANLGSKVRGVTDFDQDGVDDFVMVAQFGNPINSGPVGEAYLLYGQNGVRFGGTISANAIGQPFNQNLQTLSGVIFQAPPVRNSEILYPGRTDGITDIDFIEDMTGDGRPELLFGLSHVHGAYDSTDFDPNDETPTDFSADFCYADGLVNNFTDGGNERQGVADQGFYAGGMAVVVNSTNRDDEGLINPDRLESTAIALELVGQFVPFGLDNEGINPFGNIIVRAQNEGVENLGTDPEEAGRISGARLIGGFFDWVHQLEPPREDMFGATISSISDLTSDGLDEYIVSSPTNERFIADLQNVPFSQQLFSTTHAGSITVFPGSNYNVLVQRAISDETGTSVTPFLDQSRLPPFGSCDDTGGTPRHLFVRAETFEIFAEDVDDYLGGGKSAGDFNQDGLGDILCSAPLNDRGSVQDTGAVYIIYGRQIFGQIQLSRADDPVLRPPMLRIRGQRRGDQIGMQQARGLDVNGDRVDDVFFSSPRTDFGGITRNQCIADYNRDGVANTADLSLVAFTDCKSRFGKTVFNSDSCNAFDYDNDSDIDDADECVYCCLSGACTVDSACLNGQNSGNCCADMVDNGFVGVVFGGRFIDGDRTLDQMATSDLPGVGFYGGAANDLAGWDVSSAGDFNQDGYGDILIAAPGEARFDGSGRLRVGVVYLVFGGTHLINTVWNLSDPDRGVGTDALPGIVFVSPYVSGRPNEAAPTAVGFIGDINNDGFGDIAIGNPRADFIDLTFPQGPDAPGGDASAGRRSDAGDVYLIYGNNFGPNRATP